MFEGLKVAVIGDLMLDEFIYGDAERISPEAPVPVVNIRDKKFMLGGAGNVANNIIALGAEASLYGVVGADWKGLDIIQRAPQAGLILEDQSRPTTHKIRIIARSQQLIRLDHESCCSVGRMNVDLLVNELVQRDEWDALIVADYGKGLLTSALMKPLVNVCKRRSKILAVDPTPSQFRIYSGATLLTPNEHEVRSMARTADVRKAVAWILKKLECSMLLLTQGERGMTLFTPTDIQSIPAEPVHRVYDVSGAGDTVIAVFTLALLKGMEPEAAARLANRAASIVVSKPGTATVTVEELNG
jgi:rfaE bifunctional protein kinase chain/domain